MFRNKSAGVGKSEPPQQLKRGNHGDKIKDILCGMFKNLAKYFLRNDAFLTM